ncbi:MAG: hypothetical protein A2174_00385 [Candidatus Portnoybacteria bacterium RBG_13_41_18]|uniref:Type II secretion system protein n=1 Tax=Candidatus Portnoybacteria bacterium RBG_13_41_18 TaxID=1801991 RepID=A0A1G2F717_9BACT|nr:MAG: hypothetical protein A2174_00385 [Candidatus Portnoybacteria bacterium RBG_13_41_18]
MVALAIFVVVSTTAVSIFITAIKNQRRQFLIQDLQDNARYVMEYVIKETRMSKINTIVDDEDLNITNQDEKNVLYKFENYQLKRKVVGVDTNYNSISSSNIKAEGAFSIINDPGNQQYRVTITMRAYPKDASQPEIRLQNTVAPRRYE